MANEVDDNNLEENQTQNETKLKQRVINKWPIGLKFIELLLAVICVGLIYRPLEITVMILGHQFSSTVIVTAYAGSIVPLISLLIGRFLKETVGFRTSAIFSAAYALLYFITGILVTIDAIQLTGYRHYTPPFWVPIMMIVSAILTVINSVVFVSDATLTFKYKQDF